MSRIVLTVVLPLLAPTVIYLLWLMVWRRVAVAGAGWPTLPWPWLLGAGVVLTAAMLMILGVGFGTAPNGVYVPPHLDDGQVVPGHIAPQPAAR
jgi:hypothetical protein